MNYLVRHRTVVRYDAPARLARFNLRLRPAAWPGQTVSDYALTVEPAPSSIEERPGLSPVNVSRLVIEAPLVELVIESHFRVSVDAVAARPADDDPAIAEVARQALLVDDIGPAAPANYLYASRRAPMVPAIAAWAAETLAPGRGIVAAGLALCQRIKAEFRFDPSATDASTPASEAFAAKHGVCQDFAHIMVVALRMVGLPAAYVSGYLRTVPPPGRPRLIGADATHAWVMIWCGTRLGWLGFDPTNGVATGSGHVFTAMGRDYTDVAPLDGIFIGGGEQDLDVAVDVIPEA
ncbi:MAG TPA: transglutaminase family protein [Sphingomonas sp.]